VLSQEIAKALVVAAFATLAAAQQEPGRRLDLEPDQSATVEGVRITFEGVDDDSRCPEGATCMWAGDAAAAFTIQKAPAAALHRTLHTNGRFERQVQYEGFVIRLEDVKPYPKEGVAIAKREYRASVVVTRR
jgi:hypothetical protein